VPLFSDEIKTLVQSFELVLHDAVF
jgi:hypothetical protein